MDSLGCEGRVTRRKQRLDPRIEVDSAGDSRPKDSSLGEEPTPVTVNGASSPGGASSENEVQAAVDRAMVNAMKTMAVLVRNTVMEITAENNPRSPVNGVPGSHHDRTPPPRGHDSDSESGSELVYRRRRPGFQRHNKDVKLPPFTGDREKWTVWFTRFEDIADRRGWSDDDRLDELLPRLQGSAGEFVYDQLTLRIRRSYPMLVRELETRFRRVESTKTYGTMFSRRNQKYGETVEEYAADLKRLYDKAHPRRDQETREEDLLRRFLDGLHDDRNRFQVEFIKSPRSIDEAVSEVVNLIETRKRVNDLEQGDRRARKPVRACGLEESDSEGSDDSDGDQLARVGQFQRKFDQPRPRGDMNSGAKGDVRFNSGLEEIKGICSGLSSKLEDLKSDMTKSNEALAARVGALEKKVKTGNGSFQRRDGTLSKSPRGPRACYGCGSESHFIAECPNRAQAKVQTDATVPKAGMGRTPSSSSEGPQQGN